MLAQGPGRRRKRSRRRAAERPPSTVHPTSPLALKARSTPIGRDKELERVIQILCRRRKNNPLLVGEAGVGKTAIAEGAGPPRGGGRSSGNPGQANVALDMGSLLAGTKYRGDFWRLKGVLKELQDNATPSLFIDEIHTLIGAGAASGGTLDASNLLKPALSTRLCKCIGATTTEYRGIFRKDEALSRRFQKIDVNEPSVEQTIEILKGTQGPFRALPRRQVFGHGAVVGGGASARHINDRHICPTRPSTSSTRPARPRRILPRDPKRRRRSRQTDIEEIVAKIAAFRRNTCPPTTAAP